MTRGERLPYLERTYRSVLRQRIGLPVHRMMALNGSPEEVISWVRSRRQKFDWIDVSRHNRGQNLPMNEMLDEAVRLGAKWFLRVDDDCFFESPKQWLAPMLLAQDMLMKKLGTYGAIGPTVKGLRNPIESVAGDKDMSMVPLLGGICRLMPMSVLRYFRFNERMPLGFGEAMQVANFCSDNHIPMVRLKKMIVTHGESTETQENADSDWTYEHAMLQAIPYGL